MSDKRPLVDELIDWARRHDVAFSLLFTWGVGMLVAVIVWLTVHADHFNKLFDMVK